MKPQPSEHRCAGCSSSLAVLASWKTTPNLKVFLTGDCCSEKELGFETGFSEVCKEGYKIAPRLVSVSP